MNAIPLYEFVMSHLDAKRLTQRQIADESGVPFSTVCKIAQRQVKEPSVHTVQRLADYFAGNPQPRCPCTKHCCESAEQKVAA